MDNQQLLRAAMTTVGHALFEAYGLTPSEGSSPRPGEPLNLRLASVIGFSGPNIRGTLMLAVDDEALARSAPPGSEARDWLAELANQLLGRFKNRVARFSLDLTLSTPLVILGERLSPCVRGPSSPLRWELGGSQALAWLDVELAPALLLAESATTEVASEGGLLLF